MLLAVDTSTRMIGIALHNTTNVLGEFMWHSKNYHTVELAPAIKEMFDRCQITPRQLTGLGVALGPGSFTGLRIGLALVKGIAQGLNIPIIGVPTLDFLAAGQPLSEYPMAAILQAGRGRLAVGKYQVDKGQWQSVGSSEIMTAEELAKKIKKPTIVCGELEAGQQKTLARKYRNVIMVPPSQSIRRPSILAEIALERMQENKHTDIQSIKPIYLQTGKELED
jgi:tRNA threonylcarbamoyladenosine biosynthesis protein TsaB